MSFNQQIQEQLLHSLANSTPDANVLNNALRLLAKWRCVLIQNTLVQHERTVVLGGPFVGMDFLPKSAEGCHVPKLLGCYEQPLRPFVEMAIEARYPTVINIGCAEGYYAVGMARRMPATQVFAFDINPQAQQICNDLARKNNVSERVKVGALFSPQDFDHFVGKKTLLMCDIEGGERELLDPSVSPALVGMDMIVESHECLIPGITQTLMERFSATHEITRVDDDGQRQCDIPEWFNTLAHLDQLLALWEWRSGPTPWLVMKAR